MITAVHSPYKRARVLPLEAFVCKNCGGGPVHFSELCRQRDGLVTRPYLICESCSKSTSIEYAQVGDTKKWALKETSVLANRCLDLLWTFHPHFLPRCTGTMLG